MSNKLNKHCGRGCTKDKDQQYLCNPWHSRHNTMNMFNKCPQRFRTAMYYANTNYDLYKLTNDGDYSYFRSIGFNGRDLDILIELWIQDNKVNNTI